MCLFIRACLWNDVLLLSIPCSFLHLPMKIHWGFTANCSCGYLKTLTSVDLKFFRVR